MPLLALAREMEKGNLLWIGSKNGLEREIITKEGIKFKAIAGGKLRRYFSLRNFIDPFFILIGFFQSIFIIARFKPDCLLTAGSFVSVPVVWAAWVLRVPALVHQQDVRPGLANKLMAPFAKVITVTFEKSLRDYGKKAVWTGNPARRSLEVKSQKLKVKSFNFSDDLPIILVMGGGTGAVAINKLVEESLGELTKFCQVVHIAGKGKIPQNVQSKNYKVFEFLNAEELSEAYAVSDIVISRAGMGALTELAYLGKPAIIIPMPDSHQEENAEVLRENKAAIVLGQKELDAGKFLEEIKELLKNKQLREELAVNIKKTIKGGVNKEILDIINKAAH